MARGYKWERYGQVWRAQDGPSTFRIARSAGKYFLTESIGLFGNEVGLGMYMSLAEAKEAAYKVHHRESNPIHRARNPFRDPIVYEHGDFYVTRNEKGHFLVYKMGATAATRVAYIGYEGQKGLDRAKAEIERREREHNPIHRVRGGWQWGHHGHVYKTKAGAERQMRAIFAHGYRGKNPIGLRRQVKQYRRTPTEKRAHDLYEKFRETNFINESIALTAKEMGISDAEVRELLGFRERNPLPPMESRGKAIADAILKQLGGGKFIAMTGARDFVYGPDFLQFRFPTHRRVNSLKIILEPTDLYRLEFYRITKPRLTAKDFSGGAQLVAEFDGIYADQLQPIFTRVTGLDTHL